MVIGSVTTMMTKAYRATSRPARDSETPRPPATWGSNPMGSVSVVIDMKPARNRRARPARPDRRDDVISTRSFTAGTVNFHTGVKVKTRENRMRREDQ
ncbi:hypothetical protein GCM10023082_20390 [Streptomyces tremellae]|uniref:Uncharacterized protein n=1 Tax=Streptomyces tremellae TaxID=1124239 RepID=A0ABP7EUV3_9ACTN